MLSPASGLDVFAGHKTSTGNIQTGFCFAMLPVGGSRLGIDVVGVPPLLLILPG